MQPAEVNSAAVVRSRFYPHIALVLGAVIVVGFARTFYLRASL
jgi:hypothetical protein